MTVKELRARGYKVRVTHWRYCIDRGYFPRMIVSMCPQYAIKERYVVEKLGDVLYPMGGETIIEVTHPKLGVNNKSLTLKGEAKCSFKDNYDKKLGVKIALGRIDWTEFDNWNQNYN